MRAQQTKKRATRRGNAGRACSNNLLSGRAFPAQGMLASRNSAGLWRSLLRDSHSSESGLRTVDGNAATRWFNWTLAEEPKGEGAMRESRRVDPTQPPAVRSNTTAEARAQRTAWKCPALLDGAWQARTALMIEPCKPAGGSTRIGPPCSAPSREARRF